MLGLCCFTGFSLLARLRGCSLDVECGLLLLRSMGSGAQAQQLWCTGLVAQRHVGSSPIRDWPHVSCIGRWVPHHRAPREAPFLPSLLLSLVDLLAPFSVMRFEPPTLCQTLRPALVSRCFSGCLKMCLRWYAVVYGSTCWCVVMCRGWGGLRKGG